MSNRLQKLQQRWARQSEEWRHPGQIVSQWSDALELDRNDLQYRDYGSWWEILAEHSLTLLVTREYEHLVVAMSSRNGAPYITFLRVPHPSGIVADRRRGVIHLASTRNPNQVYTLAPVAAMLPRRDMPATPRPDRPLIQISSQFYPGCLYIHDLAVINGDLYANAVGENAVVRLSENGIYERVWWPKCIETDNGPLFWQNYLQLNSIAAGASVADSYFSASAAKPSARRPGHRNFPVDRRGVIFSGHTREPVAYGLTRPHSARPHQDQLWVDNSGYGELGIIVGEQFAPVVKLPGWTRGLCLVSNIAFVGTSRVLPRFTQYAPGLEVEASVCGVHAVDVASGTVLGGIIWPHGNQLFGIEWVPSSFTQGFPFRNPDRIVRTQEKTLFYGFQTILSKEVGE